ncbi:hypothetical protein TorRG33x02_151070 [Trema orientale]|uniref:Uncharacterized protein n=1 Tax=Trema orientale TaxID=63057 RepID=A0A2P5EUM4_TREOI|nr:hypothetical protein TorRG33x02_151070 [Trema orientale]
MAEWAPQKMIGEDKTRQEPSFGPLLLVRLRCVATRSTTLKTWCYLLESCLARPPTHPPTLLVA